MDDKFNKIERETESRFAGIAMTGKRVVFLVDMSGSMGKRDLNTIDDTKWPLVVETVCKVMRSIPTLEQYQVVTFSSSANWLFGVGEWQVRLGAVCMGLLTLFCTAWTAGRVEARAGAELRGCSVAGAHTQIGASAILEDTIVWPFAEIASRSHLRNCIVRANQKAEGDLSDLDI